MATIGILSVSVQARTSKFEKGMKRASRRLSNFSAKATRFGGLIGGAVVAGVGLFVKKTLGAIDTTAKLADRIGTTTEELQKLRFAAEITGASSALLDKSLEQLSKRLGEASQGLGTGKDGLKALGIELDQVIGKDPGAQFRIIAEEISNLATQEEKVAVATQLFGRSGTALVNTLAQGEVGLDALGKQAEMLGLTFNRIDAAKIEDANDAITRLESSFQGAVNTLTIKLAPTIQKVANVITGLALKIRQADVDIIGQAKSFGLLALKIVGVLIVVPKFIAMGLKMVVMLKSLAKAGLLSKAALFGPAAIVSLTATLALATAGGIALDGVFNDITDSLGKTAREAEEMGRVNVTLTNTNKSVETSINRVSQAIKGEEKTLKSLEEQVKKSGMTDVQRFDAKIAQLEKLKSQGRITQQEFDKAADTAADSILKIPEAMQKMINMATTLFEQTRTPLEQFDSKIKGIKATFEAGFIGVALFERATNQLIKQFGDVAESSKQVEIITGSLADSFSPFVQELVKAENIQANISKQVGRQIKGQEVLNNLYKKGKDLIPRRVSASTFAEINTSLVALGKGAQATGVKKQQVNDPENIKHTRILLDIKNNTRGGNKAVASA